MKKTTNFIFFCEPLLLIAKDRLLSIGKLSNENKLEIKCVDK